jgi:DNA-binding response OmpR family regulator
VTGQSNNSPAGSPRLLLIDDDPTFSTFALQAFARAGLSADLAPTGHAGLQALAHQRFLLVFLDLVLPDINGLEVLRSIGQTPLPWRPPVVLISGLGSIPEAVAAVHSGARTFIEKPLTADDLVSTALTHMVSLPTDEPPIGSDAQQIAQWMAEAVFASVDIPTVGAWAQRCGITEMTVFARCRKLDLKAKRLLELSRLLRVMMLASGRTSRVKYFKYTTDPRTVRALLDRAGLQAADLDTLDLDTLLAKQRLLQEPRLIAEILGLLRGGADSLGQAP